jgi:hypothetical protein
MSARRTKPLAEKLLDITKAIEPIAKRGVAEEGYAFLRAVDVIGAVAPELAKKKILLRAETREIRHEGYLTSAAIVYTFEDVESGEIRAYDWRGQGYDRGGNGLAKALTAAKKSFLKDQFHIVEPDDDPEADAPPSARTAEASTIPADRAVNIAGEIGAKNLPLALVGAKLADLGAVSIETLTVDAAEAFEAWLAEEVAT